MFFIDIKRTRQQSLHCNRFAVHFSRCETGSTSSIERGCARRGRWGGGRTTEKQKERNKAGTFKLGLQAFRPDESGSYIGACYERHCSWMGWRDFGRTIPLRRIGLSAMYTRFPLLWHRCAGEARDGGASNRRTRAKSGERRWRKG